MEIYWGIGAVVMAYLLGSIPSAVWIGRVFHGVDVREHGSKNAGATNTIRVLGTKVGIVVLVIDILKGFVAVFLCGYLPISLSDEMYALMRVIVALSAVLGHVAPLYVGFKGGKGVATLFGVVVALFPYQVILIEIVLFFIIFVITKYVSLGSIIVSIFLPILLFVFFPMPHSIEFLAVVIAVFVPFTHRKNIRRLLNGEETKLFFKK
ncbi:MAG: glycerol-3-phosphate 1-O-acyltransferase PlsY [Bacteroidota bacterium]|nr:glycerol-3-phosphate 1-O-acyltransferase PlsY [Bacteroidota bacterium]